MINNYIKKPPQTAKISVGKLSCAVILRLNYMRNTCSIGYYSYGTGITDNSEVKKQKDVPAKGRRVVLKMVFQKLCSDDELV